MAGPDFVSAFRVIRMIKNALAGSLFVSNHGKRPASYIVAQDPNHGKGMALIGHQHFLVEVMFSDQNTIRGCPNGDSQIHGMNSFWEPVSR